MCVVTASRRPRDQRETEPAQPARPAERRPGRHATWPARPAGGSAPDDQGTAGDGQGEGRIAGGPQQPCCAASGAARPAADRTRARARRDCSLRTGNTGRRPPDGRCREPACTSGAVAATARKAGHRPRHQADQPRDRHPPTGGCQSAPIATGRLRQATASRPRVARSARAARRAAEAVGVGVAGEQRALEEHHRGVPHGGRAAEQRQRHAREQRLDREHQERAEQHGAGEPRQGRRAMPRGLDRKRPVAAMPGRAMSASPLDPRSGGD